jgi:alpha-ribazole phosphatase
MPPSTLIDVLRHGEPVGGARYRGRTDDALSETGWQQMADAVKLKGANLSGKTPPWTDIISSPLSRCADFARQLSNTHQRKLHIEPRLAEIDFGDWENMSSQQIMAHEPDRLKQYWNDPINITPPNGERLSAFNSRVTAAWNDILTQHAAGGNEHLLIVTHGGTLRIILSQVLAMPLTSLFSIDAPYACLTRFQYAGDKHAPQLNFHNGNLP